MAHMARQPVVPGANDNLTGVAVLLEVARRLGGRPPDGLRLVLLSTGSEEANQDGMLAFARRHFASLDRDTTTFLCLDTVGSPELVLIEGEGFLRMRDYDAGAKDLVEGAARAAGVHVRRGLRFTFGTDALIPLRQGFRVAGLGSVNEWLVPTNYHAMTDTPENVHYASVRDAVQVVLGVAARVASGQ
jgi:Zn-dependent M28 family amino/carboxypeptidase